MAIKSNHKKSSVAVFSSVAAEMAKTRVAESAKRDADTVANGGHIYVNPFLNKHVPPGRSTWSSVGRDNRSYQ